MARLAYTAAPALPLLLLLIRVAPCASLVASRSAGFLQHFRDFTGFGLSSQPDSSLNVSAPPPAAAAAASAPNARAALLAPAAAMSSAMPATLEDTRVLFLRQNAAMEQANSALERRNAELESANVGLERRNAQLQEANAEYELRYAQIEQNQRRYEQVIAASRDDAEKLRANQTQLLRQLQEAQSRVNVLENERLVTSEKMTALQNTIGSVRDVISVLRRSGSSVGDAGNLAAATVDRLSSLRLEDQVPAGSSYVQANPAVQQSLLQQPAPMYQQRYYQVPQQTTWQMGSPVESPFGMPR